MKAILGMFANIPPKYWKLIAIGAGAFVAGVLVSNVIGGEVLIRWTEAIYGDVVGSE